MVINSLGTRFNRALDRAGLPDVVGDIAGAQLDLATFNISGAAQNYRDAVSGLDTSFMSPKKAIERSRQVSGDTYAKGTGGTLASAFQKMDGELMELMGAVGKKVGSLMSQQNSGQENVGDLVGPNAPIEDRIAAFLFKQMKESDKALEAQMKKYEALGKNTTKKKSGGFFGSIKSAFKSVASTAFSIGGGALGGMVGGPIGSKLGSSFGGGLFGGMFGNKKKSSTGNNEHSKSVMNFKIQILMNKRKELHDLVSNMLKTMHSMSMVAINNIR